MRRFAQLLIALVACGDDATEPTRDADLPDAAVRAITIKSRDDAGTEFKLTTDENRSPAAVISMGANGALAYGSSGTQASNASATSTRKRPSPTSMSR